MNALRRTIMVSALCGGAALGAQPSKDRSFSFYAENDAFFGSSDSSYTNGVRAAWEILHFSPILGKWNRAFALDWVVDVFNGKSRTVVPATQACDVREDRAGGKRLCGSLGFSISQTIYTPSDIVDPALQVGDRPFAGMLYGSVYLTSLRHRTHSTTELQLGVVGPWSGSESTQSLAHWTWASGSAKPRGWHNQLGNALQVGLVNSYAFRPKYLEWCHTKFGCNGQYGENRIVDVTPRVEGVLGTHMVRASAGGTVRVGWRFPDVLGLSRISTTTARSVGDALEPWLNLFWSYDQRAVGHNTFITGRSLFGTDERWNSAREIGLKRNVREIAWGASAGFARATIVAQVVRRSGEYTPDGGWHRFGAITVMLHTPPFIPEK